MPTRANDEIIDAIQSGVNQANDLNLIPKPYDSGVELGDFIIDLYQKDSNTFGATVADGAGIFVGGVVAGTLGAAVIAAALMASRVPGYGHGVALWILYEGQAIVTEVSDSVSDYVANDLLEDLRAYTREDLGDDIWDSLDYLDKLFAPIFGNGSGPGGGTPVSDAIADAANWFRDNFKSPLVFDLGPSSLQLQQQADSGAFFDLDNDGFVENPGWTKTDGFLAADKNSNGVIDNQSELFGQDATGSAWDKLRPYDTNNNGVISGAERDALKIWTDADGDGLTDPGELKPLQQAGVASINLFNNGAHFWVGDHEIIGGGTWTKTAGGVGQYYDVFFATDQLNSWYVGPDLANPPTVDIETLFLPLSRGYGNMKALHLAMTEDAGLKAKVEIATFVC